MDAISWIESARPAGSNRWGVAQRVFGGFFLAGLVLFGALAIASPDDFGQAGGDTLHQGWPSLALVATIAVGAAGLFLARRRISAIAERNLTGREPMSGPEQHAFEPALNALAACARPLQIRFAVARVWLPGAAACLGALLAASASYFGVYALLARGEVGVQTVALALGDVVIGLGVLGLATPRLSTWRLARRVYSAVTPGRLR